MVASATTLEQKMKKPRFYERMSNKEKRRFTRILRDDTVQKSPSIRLANAYRAITARRRAKSGRHARRAGGRA